MNEAKTFESVEAYAATIQARTNSILSRLCFGHTQEAADLCTEAYTLVQAGKMKQEVGGDFDLTTLPKPKDLIPEEDTESPFYRE